jgi:hypothetical protein
MGDRGTARYHWNFPICPNRVSIDLSVIRALEQDLAKTGEQQGLLFGKEQVNATHVNGRQALAALGRDEIGAALAGARRTVVGYYRIRDGRAFILTTDEIEIARDLFRQPTSVVMLIERRAGAPAEATFFFWRGDTFVHNLPMPFPLDSAQLATTGGLVSEPPPRPGIVRRHRVALQRAAAIAGGAAGGIALAAVLMRTPWKSPAGSAAPAPSANSAVSAATTGQPASGLEFVWDPKSMPAATAGLLEIEDGGVKRTIPLDAEQLQEGRLPYAPTSNRLHVELSTLQRDGKVLDAVVSTRSLSATAPPVSVETGRTTVPAVETHPAIETKPIASADRRVPPKPFTLALTPRREEAPVVLDPPPLEPRTAGAPALPITPVLSAHVRPLSPNASVSTRGSTSAGRLIWTGTLSRRGVVELDGRSVSVGSVSGTLPGVPVAVSVSPAEFEGDGLVVYTLDAGRNNRVEAANATNGWNKVKWVWDPERVKEISILEPPNASNGFNRLAFRSDARRTSMVWIDWRVR